MCSQEGRCSLCSKQNSKHCSNCRQVSYCGTSCQRSDWSRHKPACLPVRVQEVGQAGRGLVATRKIKVGELIIRETAAISLPSGAGVWEAGQLIYRQVEKLSAEQQQEFYQLSRKQALLTVADNLLLAAGEDNERIAAARSVADRIQETAIFFNNDIGAEDDCKCLFLKLALANHSCCPNSSWTANSKLPQQLELRAAKDIEEGEEVVVNYIILEGRFMDRAARQARLRDGWAFSCTCPLCSGAPQYRLRQEEDERIKQEIRDIQQQMIQECDQNPASVDWNSLARLQKSIVDLVSQLECGKLLLFRELKSLVNLSQLAREENIQQEALLVWKELLTELNVERAWKDYNNCLGKLSEYKANLSQRQHPPPEAEIRLFLWLM